MKRIITLLLPLFLLIACVPTPDHDAVKQKDTNVLIDTVLSEQQNPDRSDALQPPVSAQFPDRMQDTFTLSQQNVQVTVDAPIRVRTDGAAFPLIRVER